jgi:hypothetical protein
MHRRAGRRAARGLGICLVLVLSGALAAEPATHAAGALPTGNASIEVLRAAETVLASHDNGRKPFVIIDKANARVFVYDGAGRLKGSDAALLGLARGDRSASDIGARKLAAIGPAERVTPAGRFLAYLDHDAHGQSILLIDYDASIALHPVIKGTVAERRAERLASATPDDNRISFGCINVPLAFYADVVSPAFAHTDGVVYILPEAGGGAALSGATVGR